MLETLFAKRASLENPSTSLSDPANWLFEALGAQPSSANVVVTEKTALQITAFWSAVSTISDTLAELPIRLVRKQRNGSTKVVNDHPALLRLKLDPNPMMTAVTLKSAMQAHSLTHGNGYAWVKSARSGEVREIWPLDPTQTKPVIKNRALWFDTLLDDGRDLLPAREVLHIPGLSRNGLAGMSVLATQRESLGHALAVQQFGSKFFANGAKPGGLLSFPNKIKDPVKIRKAVQDQYSGENVHGLLLLDGGAEYSTFAIPPEDAQFLETREFSVDDIGRMFRLPGHFLNKMGQATFNNLEQMGSHFVQYTMMPWIVRWEQEATRKLLTESERRRGMMFKLIPAGLMRGDFKSRAEVYAKGIQWSWLVPNEARAFEEMDPIEGLDKPLRPMNMVVVGEEPQPQPSPIPTSNDDDDSDDDDDDGNDDDADNDDDNPARSYLILRAMCDRLCTQERNAVRRILNADGSMEQRTTKLKAFFDKHGSRIAENLALDPEIARQYCRSRFDAMTDAENDIDQLLCAAEMDASASNLYLAASEDLQ